MGHAWRWQMELETTTKEFGTKDTELGELTLPRLRQTR